MKVIYIRNASPQDFGGAEKLAANMAQELCLNNATGILISSHLKLIKYSREMGVKTIKGIWWKKQNWSRSSLLLFPLYITWQSILYFWYLFIFAKIKPDAIHILSKDDFISGTLAAKTLKKKVYWTDCADLKHIFKNTNKFLKNPIGKIVLFCSRFATTIFLVSDSESMLVEKSIGKKLPKNFTVVRIAGKKEKVTPLKRELKFRKSIVFVSTSRLVIDKGIGELISAFKKLKYHEKYLLWIIGDGPEENRFKKMAKDYPNIKFLGFKKNPLSYVASSDIFVLPTYHEGFSLSLTEAAMLGKPMIATNVGGNPELVKDGINGLLVPSKDVGSLAKAMDFLAIKESKRKEFGLIAKKEYTNNFDFSLVFREKIMALYEEE